MWWSLMLKAFVDRDILSLPVLTVTFEALEVARLHHGILLLHMVTYGTNVTLTKRFCPWNKIKFENACPLRWFILSCVALCYNVGNATV